MLKSWGKKAKFDFVFGHHNPSEPEEKEKEGSTSSLWRPR